MGQKSILNTLRLNNKNLNLTSNIKNNLSLSIIQIYLNKIFLSKNFILDRNFVLNNKSILIYHVNIFICFQPLSKYKKKLLKYKKKNLNQILINKHLNIISKIFNNKFKILKLNLLKFTFKILNIHIEYKLLIKLYFIFKIHINLFEKRFYFFIDFLKVATLFSSKKITVKTLIFMFSKIFSRLHKRKHSRFLIFIKTLFNFYVSKNFYKGFKLIINGKFGGKTMSSINSLMEGNISIQSLKKNIEYSKIHTYTPYGVYGIKLWVYN